MGGSTAVGPGLVSVTLVLGGARSGKSAHAEGLVEGSGLAPLYLATGRAWDGEMRARIDHHVERRGPDWRTVEEPLDLVKALRECAGETTAILVDCLTFWITNLMMDERDVDAEGEAFAAALQDLPGYVVVVSNEVGMGIVPENAMARAFRDHAGRLHQRVAAVADEVVLVAAGLPLKLKG